MSVTRIAPATPADRLRGYPRWARELDARLPVSPQIVLVGNVDDEHLVAGTAPLWSTVRTVAECLAASGFVAVVGWDVVAGTSVLCGEERLAAPVLGARPRDAVPDAAGLAELMSAVVHANERAGSRIALVVDGAPRLSASGTDEAVHRMYVAARGLLRGAPRNGVPGDRRDGLYNTVVWIADRESDLPHWLVGAESIPVVSLPLPEMAEREPVAGLFAPALPGWTGLDEPTRATAVGTLTRLTQGMPLSAVRATVNLARDRGVPAVDVQDAVRLLRSGIATSPWHEPGVRAAIQGAEPRLGAKVLGQDRAVRTVTDILARAALGLSGAQTPGHPSRPQGVMFFAGPTGVGKTELAKQIATLVFGREEAMQRFDMSEFAAEQSEARLIGSPPGYVGHDAGGELTNAVRQRPFSLLLFDEIEKAHPRILDKFLQILEDGRLTDGSGATVHFTESLIVFTSNLGVYEEKHGRREPIVRPGEQSYDELAEKIRAAIRTAFTEPPIGRPELLNRIGDNIVVFDFITEHDARRILRRNLAHVAAQVARSVTGIQVVFTDDLHEDLGRIIRDDPTVLEFGGRAVGSLVESRVINPLAAMLIGLDPPCRLEVYGCTDDGLRTNRV